MIDAPATQNRAMEWQAWRQKVDGELYYDTTYAFTRGDAWSSQYYFGGNGDGTLFYPGTPAKIGGTTHIPIASLRLKMIREGMEDYEYLKALADAGDAAMADAEAAALSPKAYQNMNDPAQIDAARHRIALRIEQLTGQTPPPMDGSGAPAQDTSGSGGGGNGATTGDTSARPRRRRRPALGAAAAAAARRSGQAAADFVTPCRWALMAGGGDGSPCAASAAWPRRAPVADWRAPRRSW